MRYFLIKVKDGRWCIRGMGTYHSMNLECWFTTEEVDFILEKVRNKEAELKWGHVESNEHIYIPFIYFSDDVAMEFKLKF